MTNGVVSGQQRARARRAYSALGIGSCSSFGLGLVWIVDFGRQRLAREVGRNLRFHHVFSSSVDSANQIPTAFRPPLCPTLIAALWFGDSAPIQAVLLLQAAMGAATVTLCYLIARDLFGRRIAILAGSGLQTVIFRTFDETGRALLVK